MGNKKKKRRWGIGRILKIVAIVIVGLLVSARVFAPLIGRLVANKKLPAILNTEASIANIDLGLIAGYAAVEGVRISQPQGFEGDDLVNVLGVQVNVKTASLVGSPLVVEQVVVDDPSIHLIRDTNGILNATALAPSTEPTETGGDPGDAPSAPPSGGEAGETGEPAAPPPPITVESLVVNNLSFKFSDLGIGDEPMHIQIAGLDLVVKDVVIDAEQSGDGNLPGSAVLTGTIVQRPLPDAQLGLVASIGAVGQDVPAVNAKIRIVGLELDTFGAAVPPGASQTLGGETLDVAVDLAMSPDFLDCSVAVKTISSTVRFSVGGTPKEPVVDKSNILFSLMSRGGGAIGRLANNIGGAGYEVADTAVETVEAVGKGVIKTVGSVAGGLFKTVKGVATGDMKEAGAGLRKTTVGTVQTLAGTVTNAASQVAEGGNDVADAAMAEDDVREWREANPERWDVAWNDARKGIAMMPYPSPEAVKAAKEETGRKGLSGAFKKKAKDEPAAEGDAEAAESEPEKKAEGSGLFKKKDKPAEAEE